MGKIGAGRKEQRVTSKATPTDLVTEADQLLEEFIISTLRDRFPSHRYTSHTHVHTHVHTGTHTHTSTHKGTHTHTHKYTHTYTQAHRKTGQG